MGVDLLKADNFLCQVSIMFFYILYINGDVIKHIGLAGV